MRKEFPREIAKVDPSNSLNTLIIALAYPNHHLVVYTNNGVFTLTISDNAKIEHRSNGLIAFCGVKTSNDEELEIIISVDLTGRFETRLMAAHELFTTTPTNPTPPADPDRSGDDTSAGLGRSRLRTR